MSSTENPTLRAAYDMGYRQGTRAGKPGLPQGGKDFPRGVMYWNEGKPEANPETIRQEGMECLGVALSGPWEEVRMDRVRALPDLDSLLAEFGRGYADGEDGDAETEARIAADPQWRGWGPGESPCYRPPATASRAGTTGETP